MLEKAFNDVYTKFKLHFYQNVFQRFATREATLTTVESFCMEGIMAMGEPTIAEFSRMMQISTPNAAYKIGSLVRKGYVEKIQSTTDRREYHLRPTQKYIDYYNISYSYLSTVVQRVNKRFPKEDVKKLEQMLTIISNELMPELNLENNPEAPEEKKTARGAAPFRKPRKPVRRPRAARQDCPTEMWSSPVFFCRNGPCGQQKKPRRACGTLRGEAAACGPAASGNSDWQEILGEQLFGGIVKECDAWPKGSAGRLPGAFGGWGSVLGLVEHGLALALHPISRCRQHHACAQHQVCQPAAGAGLDQLGILHHGAHRTASLNLFSLPLPHHASLLLLCRSPVVFLHYITSVL